VCVCCVQCLGPPPHPVPRFVLLSLSLCKPPPNTPPHIPTPSLHFSLRCSPHAGKKASKASKKAAAAEKGKEGAAAAAAAKDYLEALAAQGRYQRDVWY